MKKSKRIEVIDIAKAITIFLVVFGHTVGNYDTVFYRLVVYAFHMPLFFFLAGMSIKLQPFTSLKEWKSFIRKNILALVVPYLIWGLIYAPFSFPNIGMLLYGSWAALGKMGTLTSLWYLSCFFVSRIFVQGVISFLGLCRVKNLPLWCGICAVPMMAIGLLLPHSEAGYFWCIDVAFTASGFILLGAAFRIPLLILAQQSMARLWTVLVVSAVVFCMGTFGRADDLGLMIMCDAQYVNEFWFIVNSVSGSMIVLTVSMMLTQTALDSPSTLRLDAVRYIGLRTLGIFLLHKNFLLEVVMPFVRGIVPESWPLVVPALAGTCIAMVFSVVMCRVIERYVPQLLGKFPKYEHAD